MTDLRVRYSQRDPETGEYQEVTADPLHPRVELLLSPDDDDWPHLEITVQPDGDVRLSWQSLRGPDTISVIPSSSNVVVIRPTSWRQ